MDGCFPGIIILLQLRKGPMGNQSKLLVYIMDWRSNVTGSRNTFHGTYSSVLLVESQSLFLTFKNRYSGLGN